MSEWGWRGGGGGGGGVELDYRGTKDGVREYRSGVVVVEKAVK